MGFVDRQANIQGTCILLLFIDDKTFEMGLLQNLVREIGTLPTKLKVEFF